jgi:hypothetical protein
MRSPSGQVRQFLFDASHVDARQLGTVDRLRARLRLLLSRTPPSKAWHTAEAQTKTWRNLHGNHFLEIARPGVLSTVPAVFGWTLRNGSGAVVSRHEVRTGSLKVHGPGCKIGIGGGPRRSS